MKNKLFKIALCIIIFLFTVGIFPASSVGEAQEIADGIIAYELNKSGTSSVQNWLDGGQPTEWYVIALSQYGDYDLSAYETALLGYLSENTVGSASSRLKYALALSASGSTDVYIYNTLNDSIGRQGVMSWVFGLHLLNNGYTSNEYSQNDIKQKLLSLQLDDGGWAVMGTNGDADVTAMTVQALAPHYNSDTAVKTAVDKALELLSKRQKESGDFASYGVNNAESTAQVLIALSELGIDCKTDNRFIKNGNTLLDALSLYRLADGSFSHKQGGDSNGTATAQAFCSVVSYLRMKNGEGGLYLPDEKDPDGLFVPEADSTDTEQKKQIDYKPWVSLAVVIAAGVVCLVLFLLKKRNAKSFLIVGSIAAAAVLAVMFTDIQSADSYYSDTQKTDVAGTVTLTVRCDTIPDKSAEHIPDDGVILDTALLDIEAGETVYDILLQAALSNKIHIETNGGYVEGIANIYEFDFGELSGWQYHVNGESPSVGCDEYELSDGDRIEWLYTCQLGQDIK